MNTNEKEGRKEEKDQIKHLVDHPCSLIII